jgi:hypothetical protein
LIIGIFTPETRMNFAKVCVAAFVVGPAFAADPPPQQPADPCKSGLPWVLPPVEPGFDVSEQYLLSGAVTPVQITVCHCTPKTPGKPTPHVWVNVTKKAPQVKQQDGQEAGADATAVRDVPSPQQLDRLWKESKGKSQFEFLVRKDNTVNVTRLSAPSCMTAVGLSVLVMHSNTEAERWGTSSTK